MLCGECLRALPKPAFEAGVGLGCRYHPHNFVAVVFGRGQAIVHRPQARPVTTCRHLLSKRLMRPLEIVDLAPGIESTLRLGEIAKAAQCQHLDGKRAVEAFVLAAALRVVRAAMNDLDAELEKPYRKPCPPFA